jgi:hypothetical protein
MQIKKCAPPLPALAIRGAQRSGIDKMRRGGERQVGNPCRREKHYNKKEMDEDEKVVKGLTKKPITDCALYHILPAFVKIRYLVPGCPPAGLWRLALKDD